VCAKWQPTFECREREREYLHYKFTAECGLFMVSVLTCTLPISGPQNPDLGRKSHRYNFWDAVGVIRKDLLQTRALTYLLTYLLHGAESFLSSYLVCSYSRNSPHFTEPQGSLPHSQASATCLYSGPAQSSPHAHIPPPGDPA